ncbi:MAG: ketoacyl-ACP synthase III [Dehalococcoidia bacterium]|nr:ketoacyl-ACP synthase III [Dehalococcoidia bacterium]
MTGWGKYLPERVLTNQELEQKVYTSDSWITSRTGISGRRIAASTETASTLALEASRAALRTSGLDPAALDLIIVATCTPEYIFPACASVLQDLLGARRAAAFDINGACTGFIHALATGCQFISAGTYRNVLIAGSEIYSRILDWQDRNTCVLFGDGAGAVVLGAADSPSCALSIVLGNDGSGTDIIYTPGPCGINDGRYFLTMRGPEVFKFAVKVICQATRDVVAQAGLQMSDIDLIIPHQANTRIIKTASRTLGVPMEKFFVNVDRYGNTSAASIPIALCEAVEEGKIKDGDNLVLVGFGGGLSWGAVTVKWAGD